MQSASSIYRPVSEQESLSAPFGWTGERWVVTVSATINGHNMLQMWLVFCEGTHLCINCVHYIALHNQSVALHNQQEQKSGGVYERTDTPVWSCIWSEWKQELTKMWQKKNVF